MGTKEAIEILERMKIGYLPEDPGYQAIEVAIVAFVELKKIRLGGPVHLFGEG